MIALFSLLYTQKQRGSLEKQIALDTDFRKGEFLQRVLENFEKEKYNDWKGKLYENERFDKT